jgi:hypothetical protein
VRRSQANDCLGDRFHRRDPDPPRHAEAGRVHGPTDPQSWRRRRRGVRPLPRQRDHPDRGPPRRPRLLRVRDRAAVRGRDLEACGGRRPGVCPCRRRSPWNLRFLPHYFGRFAPADFHADLAAVLDGLHLTRGAKHSYIAPRGGAKSPGGRWPTRSARARGWEPYTLILSDSSEQADELLSHVKKELEDNERIAAVYPEAGEGPEWNQSRIRLQRVRGRGARHRQEDPRPAQPQPSGPASSSSTTCSPTRT